MFTYCNQPCLCSAVPAAADYTPYSSKTFPPVATTFGESQWWTLFHQPIAMATVNPTFRGPVRVFYHVVYSHGVLLHRLLSLSFLFTGHPRYRRFTVSDWLNWPVAQASRDCLINLTEQLPSPFILCGDRLTAILRFGEISPITAEIKWWKISSLKWISVL